MIRAATAADAAAIAAIYNHYVATTTISFEERPVGDAEMAERVAGVTAGLPWLVFEEDGAIMGYAYATPWRARSAYRYSVESSVYVSRDYPRRGIGKRLYLALIEDLRARGVHMVIGGIAQPNEGSVALHESVGFVKVAHFKEVGWKFERWVDVGYWELNLDTVPPA